MKKVLALLLAAILTLSFSACGGATNPTTPTDTPTEPSYAISQITIGTTSAVETATREEYAFDMLSSGVSQPPLVYQDLSG